MKYNNIKQLIQILLFISLINFLSCQEVIKTLRDQLNESNTDLPSFANFYINNIFTVGEVKFVHFSIKQIETKLFELGLDEKTSNKIKGIIYSKSLKFQGFNLSISSKIGKFSQIVGIANNINDNVELAFFKTETQGTPIFKYYSIKEKNCQYYFFFFESCTYVDRIITRSFSTEDLNIIEKILRYFSFTYIKIKLNEMVGVNNEDFYNEHQNNLLISTKSSTPRNHYSSLNYYEIQILNIFNNFSDDLFISRIKNNIISIVDGILIQNYNEINKVDLNTFFNNLSLSQIFPVNLFTQVKTLIEMSRINNDVFRILSTFDKNIILYEIFIHYSEDGEYNFEIRKVQTGINLNLNLILMKFTNEEKYYLYLKNKLEYNGGLQIIINLLELMSQKKSEDGYHKNVTKVSNLMYLANTDEQTPYSNLISCFFKYTSEWGIMVETFKSSKSSKIKDMLVRQGFDKFDQSAQIQVISGMKKDGLGKLSSLISSRLKIPENNRIEVEMILLESEWMDFNLWANFDIVYSLGISSVKYASIFCHKDEKDKYYFIISEVQAAFELADDLLIITQKLSILGGMWSERKEKVSKITKTTNYSDVITVFNFFNLIAYKQVANQFGIKFQLPL